MMTLRAGFTWNSWVFGIIVNWCSYLPTLRFGIGPLRLAVWFGDVPGRFDPVTGKAI